MTPRAKRVGRREPVDIVFNVPFCPLVISLLHISVKEVIKPVKIDGFTRADELAITVYPTQHSQQNSNPVVLELSNQEKETYTSSSRNTSSIR